MALIKCPECGYEVSDKAETCPKCSYPIAGGGSTQAHGGKVQTIEKTSKEFKLQILLSSFLTISSLLILAMGLSSHSDFWQLGAMGFVIGLIWFVVVRFMIWWNHG